MGKQDDIATVHINRPVITKQQEFGWPGDIPANGEHLNFSLFVWRYVHI